MPEDAIRIHAKTYGGEALARASHMFVLANNSITGNGNCTTSGVSDGANDLGPRLLRTSSKRVPIVAPYRLESTPLLRP